MFVTVSIGFTGATILMTDMMVILALKKQVLRKALGNVAVDSEEAKYIESLLHQIAHLIGNAS